MGFGSILQNRIRKCKETVVDNFQSDPFASFPSHPTRRRIILMKIEQQTFSTFLDLLFKATAVLAAVAFFLGFLVVNSYLAEFGFWDFDFLKVEYISAGLLFMILVTIGIFGVILREKILNAPPQKTGRQTKAWRRFSKCWSYFILFAINFLAFFIPINPQDKNAFLHDLTEVIMWTIILHLSFLAIRYTYRIITSHKKFPTFDEIFMGWKFFNLIWAPLLILFTFVTFSMYIYPLVPRAWGGGKPTAVVLYLNNDPQFTSPLNAELIYQSPDSVLVLVRNETYLIKQISVTNIQYLEKGPTFDQWISGIIQR